MPRNADQYLFTAGTVRCGRPERGRPATGFVAFKLEFK